MGFLMMIVTAIGGIVGAVFLGLVKDEASAWLPAITRAVVAVAVRRLPKNKREMYAAEWEADLSEYPGKLSQFVRSLGFLKAGCDMEIFPTEVLYRAQRWFGLSILSLSLSNWLTDNYVPISHEATINMPWSIQAIMFFNYIATLGFCWATYRMIRMRATLMNSVNRKTP